MIVDEHKLLEWIENSPEADGFWNGEKSLQSFDALTDAINSGVLSSTSKNEEPKLVEVICEKCNGAGYHHGFGEGGHDPDYCTECGGIGKYMDESIL